MACASASEFVAKLTAQLDESARVNIALMQQQQRDTEQELMLEHLTSLSGLNSTGR
jgi:hypothetical protein